jgi:hypothetical protein
MRRHRGARHQDIARVLDQAEECRSAVEGDIELIVSSVALPPPASMMRSNSSSVRL